MKKIFLCGMVYLSAVYFQPQATAHNPAVTLMLTPGQVNDYIVRVYGEIDFEEKETVPFDIFNKAFRGYLNLKNAGKLSAARNILSICDLSRSANEFRLWIIDMEQRKVLYHTYVAHGQGSGEEFATAFSNRENSHQSSLGFYVTGETYNGAHGLSLRLHGMDNGYNSAAFDRGIVVHGTEYVCDRFISENKRLGRSWGCPAVPAELSADIISTIRDSTCLFVYYPQKKYLASAYWLNKKIDRLPEQGPLFIVSQTEEDNEPAAKRVVISRDSFERQGRYLPRIDRF